MFFGGRLSARELRRLPLTPVAASLGVCLPLLQ